MSRRKAKYDNDSSDDDDSHHHKRRKHSDTDDIEERLENLITRVCEKSSSSLETNLEGLTVVLSSDMVNHKSIILRIISSCAVTMPEHMTIYTTLVGLLNAKNYNSGGEFVESIVRLLKEALKNGEYDLARLLLRFLSDLVNCHVVTCSSLMNLYKSFLEVIHEERIPVVRSDWYVYAVLSCLAWVGLELSQKMPEDVNGLLSTVKTYLDKRRKNYLPLIRVWSADQEPAQEDYLDCLWEQTCDLKARQWEESEIVRPYVGFDGVLCDALQHKIPTVIIPSHEEYMQYPLPSIVFTMFEQQDMPSDVPPLPSRHSLERYLVDEHLHRALHTHHLERKDCAGALLTIPLKGKYPLNYMIVEAVFSQLFQLPRPPYLELFYGSLLIELCKLQPSSMPQVLAQATECLFDRLKYMNTSCIERFSSWFSYHLSNFQFKWSWDDWSECLADDIEDAQPKFLRETFLKCLRLSYHQRVVELAPASFTKLLPAKPAPDYKYEREGSGAEAGTMIAHRLMDAIKSKCSTDDAAAILSEVPNTDERDRDCNETKIDIFVQTLLFLGAKSFSHSFAAISKFHPVLKALGESNDQEVADRAQMCLLSSVHDLWRTHQQMIVVLVDKLLKTAVVQCSAVAAWIFSPSMASELTSWYVWEILHSTIKKMTKQVNKLDKEVEDMNDRLKDYKRKKSSGYDVPEEPTEDQMEEDIVKTEENFKLVRAEQKKLFQIIFQSFIEQLSVHLVETEKNQMDYCTPWYKTLIDRLQQVFLVHHEQVFEYVNANKPRMFTSDIHPLILDVFKEFCALRA